MAVIDRVADIVNPLIAAADLELYDIEQAGPTLRISVDQPGPGGVDGDILTELTRSISSAMDEADPISGSYTLEITSPGLERKLRTEAHYLAAIGEQVKVKLEPGTPIRRAEGELVAADSDSITLRADDGTESSFQLSDITTTRTVFVWEKGEKSGAKQSRSKKSKKQHSTARSAT